MKVTEIEVGVTYQPRSYESVRASVRVELLEGDTVEDVTQWAAEKAAEIASNNEPDNYKGCMELLGRDISSKKLESLKTEWDEMWNKIHELKVKIRKETPILDKLKFASDEQDKLHQIMEAANCWSTFQCLISELAEKPTFKEKLPSSQLPHLPLPKVEDIDGSLPDDPQPF